MNTLTIPNAVISVTSDALGTYYYSHRKLNILFEENGAPGEPPDGNCVEKCKAWLKRCNSETSDPLHILGKILEELMEVDHDYQIEKQKSARERVIKILTNHGLTYQKGRVLGINTSISTRSLHEILKNKDLHGMEQEFKRALESVDSDPPAALTAACSIVESLCKIYIEDEHLDSPSDQTLKPLWKIVSSSLGFEPGKLTDDDLKKILSGLTSTLDGLGALRTHAGSAHGRGRKTYRIEGRHARLAIHAAHTLCIFIIETWIARKNSPT